MTSRRSPWPCCLSCRSDAQVLAALDRYCHEWRHVQAALDGQRPAGAGACAVARSIALCWLNCVPAGWTAPSTAARKKLPSPAYRCHRSSVSTVRFYGAMYGVYANVTGVRTVVSATSRTELSAATACSQYTYCWLGSASASTSCACSSCAHLGPTKPPDRWRPPPGAQIVKRAAQQTEVDDISQRFGYPTHFHAAVGY